MNSDERECPSCRRIYNAADVPDDICPFCEPETKLIKISEKSHLIDDVFSVELGWPQGQAQTLATISPNYMDAQLTKAQLESYGIPVLIEGSGYGSALSSLARYRVFVPESFLPQATQILKGQ